GGSTSSNTGFNCSSTVRASHTRNWIDTTISTSNNNPRKVCAVNQLHIRLTAIALSPPHKLFPQKTASDACSAGPCHQKDEGEDTWNWRAIHAPATASRDLYFPREMIEDADHAAGGLLHAFEQIQAFMQFAGAKQPDRIDTELMQFAMRLFQLAVAARAAETRHRFVRAIPASEPAVLVIGQAVRVHLFVDEHGAVDLDLPHHMIHLHHLHETAVGGFADHRAHLLRHLQGVLDRLHDLIGGLGDQATVE